MTLRFLLIKTITIAFVIQSLHLQRANLLQLSPIDGFIAAYFIFICVLYAIELLLNVRAWVVYWAYLYRVLGADKTVREYLCDAIDTHLRHIIFEILSPAASSKVEKPLNRYDTASTKGSDGSAELDSPRKSMSVAVDSTVGVVSPTTVIVHDVENEKTAKENFRWTQMSAMNPGSSLP